jgi:hypothetical protein
LRACHTDVPRYLAAALTFMPRWSVVCAGDDEASLRRTTGMIVECFDACAERVQDAVSYEPTAPPAANQILDGDRDCKQGWH